MSSSINETERSGQLFGTLPVVDKQTKRKLALGGVLAGAGILFSVVWPWDPRQRFLWFAAKEIGSTDWEKYLQGVTLQTPTTKPHWCGIFALWSMHRAGYACDVMWDLITGRGFLYRLPLTTNPQPGDMGYLHAYQHHAIIEKVEGDKITTIDGNSGQQSPSRVLRTVRSRDDFAFFYDTSPLWLKKC